ncbi:glutathione S-transferase family protein [Variovorax sp. OV329]|uniref:glutathione S-transferase family protein n=1 Tax=Variovorax sp. OV329 TaxID=1882825 RepID=UPI0008E11342|nr:glutathione S-transferase [Variovorax sp. OV329]SFM97108.1 glutathione S-transferase [Variovorax sp. OV329]
MTTVPRAPLQLHRFALSGHAHRVHLALGLMGLPYELIDVDLPKGEHKTPEFLKMHPFGQVPVLVDGDDAVFDSNAILVYLATRYDADERCWLPRDALAQARVQAWLSVAAGQIAFGPASARLVTLFGQKLDADSLIARSHALLKVMDKHLSTQAFLAADAPTIADIAGYSYIWAAPEGNVDLADYPAVRAWLARIEALPGFVPFIRSPVGLAA